MGCRECSGLLGSGVLEWIGGSLGCCMQFESLIDERLSSCVLKR